MRHVPFLIVFHKAFASNGARRLCQIIFCAVCLILYYLSLVLILLPFVYPVIDFPVCLQRFALLFFILPTSITKKKSKTMARHSSKG